MFPIGDFVEICRRLDEAGFCRQSPFPVLLHASAARPLNPVVDPSKQTFDRFVLDAADPVEPAARQKTPTRELKAINPDQMYTVFVVRPRRGNPDSLRIGCGLSCDVQINDQSVSKVHALLVRQGQGLAIKDNDSTTGTEVNETLLSPGQVRLLRSGDKISLGYVDLIYLTAQELYRLVRRLFID